MLEMEKKLPGGFFSPFLSLLNNKKTEKLDLFGTNVQSNEIHENEVKMSVKSYSHLRLWFD